MWEVYMLLYAVVLRVGFYSLVQELINNIKVKCFENVLS